MDAQWQNFWIESINKEAAVRFQWHLRYSKQFAKTAFQSRPKKEGLKFGSEIGQRIRLLEEQGEQTRKSASQPLPTMKKPETPPQVSLSVSDMRPPTAGTRALLYTGISAHGKGRKAYLARRKDLGPDEKYEFPVMTSADYGWKILDYVDLKKSSYARTKIIQDSFYRPSGIVFG